MASEPNNNAEEQLKRYAAERRQRAPAELHPADRRALQQEVARVYGSASGKARSWRRWLVTPQFGWAAALTALLGISFLALQRPVPSRKEEIARPPAEKKDEITKPAPPLENKA